MTTPDERARLIEELKSYCGCSVTLTDYSKRCAPCQAADQLALAGEDSKRLEAGDALIRRIESYAVKGAEVGAACTFRWQFDVRGPLSPRPTLREAIDSAISATQKESKA